MTEDEKELVESVLKLSKRYYAIGEKLADAANKCLLRQTARGIDEMVAYAFNSQGIDPRFGGGGGLPVGKHPVTITKNEVKPTKGNDGGYIELTCTAFDGPSKGASQAIRLNLHNKSADAVRIANQQLAAICAVVGVPAFQDFDELNGKPFVIDVIPQKDSNFTEVGAVFDMNGNEPKMAGAGAMQGQTNNGGFPNAQGQGQQGNGFPNGGQQNGGFPQGQQGQQGGQPDQGQQGQGNWGQQGNQGQQPQDQGQGQQGNGTAGWGQNTGQQGGQPNNGGNAAGWAQGNAGQQQGNGGGSPSWGQR